jgi:predicted exporter
VRRTVRVAFVLATLGMIAFSASKLRITTDVTNFLPDESAAGLAALSRALAAGELARTMVIAIGGEAPVEALVEAARALEARLAAHPEVLWLRAGPRPEQLEELYELYFPRRYHFLSRDPGRELPALLAPERLRERAREARRELAMPSSPLVERLVAADPLGAFRSLVERIGPPPAALAEHDGHFVSPERDLAVFLLATRSSAFDSRAQRRLLGDIERAFREVADSTPFPIRLLQSGGNRIAVHAEDEITRDVYLIAAVSAAGVAALVLVFFRSLHGVLLAAIPPLAGLGLATTLGLLFQGTLDGLTLAFGAALIGVAIDYPIHLINHHALSGGRDAYAVARELRPPLVLGAATTIASYAGLALTSFPGFREIGSFAMVAMAGALLATLYVLPSFLPERARVSAVGERVALRLAAAARALERRRGAVAAAIGAFAAGGALALPWLVWNDDLSALASLDPELLAEDAALRRRVVPFDGARLVIATAPDLESALELDGRVHDRLERTRGEGAFRAMRSLHALLWPERLQRESRQALEREPELFARVASAFAAEGFRSGALEPFRASLDEAAPPPLRLEDLERSALGELIGGQVLRLDSGIGLVTFLEDVRDPRAVQSALDGLPGVVLFEQRAFANQIFAEFRATTVRQIGVGCALVLVALLARYRALRPALVAFLPSVAVALVVLGAFALAGVEANLLHVVALTLVMGMGVDYGIFLVDSARDPRTFGTSLLSLLLASLATVFVFGTLALSDHVALRAIGLTTGLGIVLSFLFAPAAFALLQPASR